MTRLPDHFTVKVVGLSWAPGYPDHILGLEGRWTPLSLRPEADNPVDPEAVVVWDNTANQLLGHLPATLAHRMKQEMDESGCVWAVDSFEVLINSSQPRHPGLSIKCIRRGRTVPIPNLAPLPAMRVDI